MDNLEKARRRNRILLAVSIILFAGALSLVFLGYRGLAGWAVLLSSFANLMSAIATQRSLGRLAVAPTYRDPAG
jgi:hypothetical protein